MPVSIVRREDTEIRESLWTNGIATQAFRLSEANITPARGDSARKGH